MTGLLSGDDVQFVAGVVQPSTTILGHGDDVIDADAEAAKEMIALGYALIPDVSSAYWIFSVITTQVYLIMYLLMFVAAVRLRRNDPDHPRGYRAPMLVGLCGVGFAASLAALLIGFIPPSQFGEGSIGLYLLIVGGGALGLGLLVPYLFYRARKPSWKLGDTKEVVA
jgi:amino acid transporter